MSYQICVYIPQDLLPSSSDLLPHQIIHPYFYGTAQIIIQGYNAYNKILLLTKLSCFAFCYREAYAGIKLFMTVTVLD